MNISIYHNPSCSKSREALSLLKNKKAHFHVKEYLQAPLNLAELTSLMEKLSITDARYMMRTTDNLYKTLALDNSELSTQQLLAAIIEHPALLQRPIVVKGNIAKIGRPPELILTIL